MPAQWGPCAITRCHWPTASYHPSFILRQRDPDAAEKTREALVADLRVAAKRAE
jgi:hypothetical protein